MWSLERSSLEGWRLFVSFYVRRAFRLYPLSIVCVLLAYSFDARWDPVNLWQNLTLTQNLFFTNHPVFPPTLTPLWSLPLEVEMYAVLPLLFLIFRHGPVLAIIWTVCVAVAFAQSELGDRFLIRQVRAVFPWWSDCMARDAGTRQSAPTGVVVASGHRNGFHHLDHSRRKVSSLRHCHLRALPRTGNPTISRNSVERRDNGFEAHREIQLWHISHTLSHYGLCVERSWGS